MVVTLLESPACTSYDGFHRRCRLNLVDNQLLVRNRTDLAIVFLSLSEEKNNIKHTKHFFWFTAIKWQKATINRLNFERPTFVYHRWRVSDARNSSNCKAPIFICDLILIAKLTTLIVKHESSTFFTIGIDLWTSLLRCQMCAIRTHITEAFQRPFNLSCIRTVISSHMSFSARNHFFRCSFDLIETKKK